MLEDAIMTNPNNIKIMNEMAKKKMAKKWPFCGENGHFCKIGVPKDIYGHFENDQFMLEVAIHDQSSKNNNIKIMRNEMDK